MCTAHRSAGNAGSSAAPSAAIPRDDDFLPALPAAVELVVWSAREFASHYPDIGRAWRKLAAAHEVAGIPSVSALVSFLEVLFLAAEPRLEFCSTCCRCLTPHEALIVGVLKSLQQRDDDGAGALLAPLLQPPVRGLALTMGRRYVAELTLSGQQLALGHAVAANCA